MTAVEFLLRQFALLGYDVHQYETIIKEAKEMEKEQIEKAYIYGAAYGIDISNNLSPDIYYNETFKSE